MKSQDLNQTTGKLNSGDLESLVRDQGANEEVPIPALTLLYHQDITRVGERVLLTDLLSRVSVFVSRLEPRFGRPGKGNLRPLEDTYISRKGLVLSKHGDGLLLDPGAVPIHIGDKRIRQPVLFHPHQLEAGIVLNLAARVLLLLHYYTARPYAEPRRFEMIGDSAAMERVRGHIAQLSQVGVPVLITGESGCGKELVAQALHDHCSRARSGKLVCLNMGGLSPELAAAELFGVQKGAYTGADRSRIGHFRNAHGGTLFLDEIGEAPIQVQTMLLRTLETGQVMPVGGGAPIDVDVRLIAATDANLDQMAQDGSFRLPLIYRLQGYRIHLPPLRERRDDIPRLFLHFLRRELMGMGKSDILRKPLIPIGLMTTLMNYDWPGNIRQLHNVTSQICIANRDGERLHLDPVLAAQLQSPDQSPTLVSARKKRRRTLTEISDEELARTLSQHDYELKAAAEALGISRPSIYKLIRDREGFRLLEDIPDQEITSAYEVSGGSLSATARDLGVSSSALERRLGHLRPKKH